MQTLTESVFSLEPPGGLFDATVVHRLFSGISRGARDQLLHRALRHAEVLRLTIFQQTTDRLMELLSTGA